MHIVSGLLTYVKTFDLKYGYNSNMPYQDIIKQLMVDNELSQQKFADILGVNQTTVSQWLLGRKKPSYDCILLIYEKFGVTPNVLFGISD